MALDILTPVARQAGDGRERWPLIQGEMRRYESAIFQIVLCGSRRSH